jgi:hypothetical protein
MGTLLQQRSRRGHDTCLVAGVVGTYAGLPDWDNASRFSAYS